MSNKKIRVGVIGSGGMGFQHALNVTKSPLAELVALADPDEKRLQESAKLVGSPKCFIDPAEMIANKEVDAVVVASPDATHAQFVMKALEEEKPVLCEKPLASTLREALEIIDKEVSIGKKLVSVGFNRRFDPAHLEVKSKVDEGKLGQPLLWKGSHRNATAMYETDGSFILNNSAGHDVDSARWLLNSAVKRVYSWGIKSHENLPEGAQTLLFVNMEMENGMRAAAEVYVNAQYGYEVELELVCQNGVVTTKPRNLSTVRYNNNQGSFVSEDFRGYFIDSYGIEMNNWLESLRDGKPFGGADAWDGYAVMATTIAAGTSLKENKIVDVETIDKPALYT